MIKLLKRKTTLTSILLSPFIVSSFMLLLPMNIAVSKTGENTSVNAVVKQSTSKRLALVVGVDDYPEAPLRFPVKDAELMTKQLESVGFLISMTSKPTRSEERRVGKEC